MAMDIFLKITGADGKTVDGESKDDKHTKEIDVLAWSWGLSNSGSTHTGGGGGAGKVNVQDVSFTKWVDSSSPKLMLACCQGDHCKEATLVVRKMGGKTPIEYIKIKMTTVLVASVSTGGSGGEDRLTENVTLNFEKFQFDYTPQKADGTGDKAIPAAWDISANKKD
jgi:type VI secretion system secreted protein Hcp